MRPERSVVNGVEQLRQPALSEAKGFTQRRREQPEMQSGSRAMQAPSATECSVLLLNKKNTTRDHWMNERTLRASFRSPRLRVSRSFVTLPIDPGYAGFVARTNAAMKRPSISAATASTSTPVPARNSRASSTW